MAELLTAAQMRALEKAAIDSGEVTGLELMERAGRGVVEAIFEEWPELAKTSHRAVVLCGPGNNGGDGFVVARLLKEWGWEVEVFLYGDAEKLPPDARVNYERWCEMGEVSKYVDDKFHLDPKLFTNGTVVVDGLFGTGLSKPVAGFNEFGWTTQMALPPNPDNSVRGGQNYPESRVVAIDIPSGIDSDSGHYLRPTKVDKYHEDIRAHLTVSFHRAKVGHFTGQGPSSCSHVVVKDIGLEQPQSKEFVQLVGPPNVPLSRKYATHKYSHGHAYILSGPAGHTGAARLAARGALRIGAGLVTVACPPDALAEHAAQLNAIMLTPVADAGVLAKRLEDERINALCLGPAMGVNDGSKDIVLEALKASRATVLDADALTVFASDPQALFDALHDNCVLTPHGGEFARLFPDIAKKLNATPTKGPAYSKVDAAREAAARAGCVVLFKGPDTVIAHPDGRCSINSAQYERAAPWLATAGSGDVLAGFITGLLARGFDPMQAAEAAAWLHVECARRFGPGLIAEDLERELPSVFRDLVS